MFIIIQLTSLYNKSHITMFSTEKREVSCYDNCLDSGKDGWECSHRCNGNKDGMIGLYFYLDHIYQKQNTIFCTDTTLLICKCIITDFIEPDSRSPPPINMPKLSHEGN